MAKRQLTVADLEAAKMNIQAGVVGTGELSIAATCIGIVEKMVKCMAHDPARPIRESEFSKKFGADNWSHFYGMHEVWLKAVAAFGGEVK